MSNSNRKRKMFYICKVHYLWQDNYQLTSTTYILKFSFSNLIICSKDNYCQQYNKRVYYLLSIMYFFSFLDIRPSLSMAKQLHWQEKLPIFLLLPPVAQFTYAQYIWTLPLFCPSTQTATRRSSDNRRVSFIVTKKNKYFLFQ